MTPTPARKNYWLLSLIILTIQALNPGARNGSPSTAIVLSGCVNAEALSSVDRVSLFETSSLSLPCLTLSSGRPRCY
jgi:hypothetical protein